MKLLTFKRFTIDTGWKEQKSSCKNFGASVATWKKIRKEILRKSFKKCCITNSLDGTEDDILWEEYQNPDNELCVVESSISESCSLVNEVVESDSD